MLVKNVTMNAVKVCYMTIERLDHWIDLSYMSHWINIGSYVLNQNISTVAAVFLKSVAHARWEKATLV